jgi:hypothetical protein
MKGTYDTIPNITNIAKSYYSSSEQLRNMEGRRGGRARDCFSLGGASTFSRNSPTSFPCSDWNASSTSGLNQNLRPPSLGGVFESPGIEV